MIEVSTPDLEDVVRLEDAYGRAWAFLLLIGPLTWWWNVRFGPLWNLAWS